MFLNSGILGNHHTFSDERRLYGFDGFIGHISSCSHTLQHFLRFSAASVFLQFPCLFFGLCTTPRTQKLALLKIKGLQVFHYLNDILLIALTKKDSAKTVFFSLWDAQALGRLSIISRVSFSLLKF